MEEVKDVILHVYLLQSEQGGSFVSRFLPSMGMGAYHTSLEIDGYRYTFAANAGIIKTKSRNDGVPSGASYKESIPLGACACNRGEINAIVNNLGEFFHGNAYHLVHRNCNHFSETLATAAILNDKLVDMKQGRLKSYPEWINRLANTSKIVISHDEDILPCDILLEARKAVGADTKTSWGLKSDDAAKKRMTSVKQKKELTEKQKAMLSKIRGGNA